jgi:hypothetical protein
LHIRTGGRVAATLPLQHKGLAVVHRAAPDVKRRQKQGFRAVFLVGDTFAVVEPDFLIPNWNNGIATGV